MPQGFYKEVAKIIAELGFVQVKGGKGGHQKWYNEELCTTLIVPSKILSRHTANGILKDAGHSGKV